MLGEVIETLRVWDPNPPSMLIAGSFEMVAAVRRACATLGIQDDRVNYELHA